MASIGCPDDESIEPEMYRMLIGSAISCGVGALVTLLAGSAQRRTPVAVSAGRPQLQVQVGTMADSGLSVGLRGRW